MREVLGANFYSIRTGCACRTLPYDFRKWRTGSGFYAHWCDSETWKTINARLCDQVRCKAKRKSEPRISVLDSQGVKTSVQTGERGFDA